MNRRFFVLCHLLFWLFSTWALAAGAGAGSGRDKQIACTRLETRIAEVRLKLRMGYTARQGRLYRQKLAGFEAEHKASCR